MDLNDLLAPNGIVLSLDDLGYSDQATLDTVHYLARNIGALPIVVLGNFNSRDVGPDHALRRLMAFLSRTRQREHRVLELLTDHDIYRLLQEVLEEGADMGDVAAFLSERTGGNPLFLRELLDHLGRQKLLQRYRTSENNWIAWVRAFPWWAIFTTTDTACSPSFRTAPRLCPSIGSTLAMWARGTSATSSLGR